MDSQIIELRGRNWLMNELMEAGLEFALPARDRGIDLVIYSDLEEKVKRFIAVPVQMKAASQRAFSIDRRYMKFPNLLLVYVWELDDPANTHTYALNYPEVFRISQKMGWTESSSWKINGRYSTSNPSKKLMELLIPHRMSPIKWRSKVGL